MFSRDNSYDNDEMYSIIYKLITSSSWYQKMKAGDSSGPSRIVQVKLIVEPFWT